MLPNESVTLLYTSYSLRGISIVYNKMGVLHVFKSLNILSDGQHIIVKKHGAITCVTYVIMTIIVMKHQA